MQNLLVHPSMTIVQPTGHINASNATEFQQQLLETVSSDQHTSILVDLGLVDSLDSAGLMSLVSALTLSQQMDKDFGICCVPASIRIIFEVTQLDRAFKIFENRSAYEAAIA